MIDSGMMAHGEGYGISRLGVRQVAPSMATIVCQAEGGSILEVSAAVYQGQGREGHAEAGISSERMKRMRNVSPAVSEMSETESRGLFVLPQ